MIKKRALCVVSIALIVATLSCGSEEIHLSYSSPVVDRVDQVDGPENGEARDFQEISEKVVIVSPKDKMADPKNMKPGKVTEKAIPRPGSSDQANPLKSESLDKRDRTSEKMPSADLLSEKEDLTTVAVVKILKPSVVQITANNIAPGSYNQAMPRGGVGSGVILDKEGRILTNNHVALGGPSLRVTLGDGRTYPAKIVGNDPRTDLAVIQITAAKLNPARLGVSSDLQVGEDVIAVGHALGLKGGPTVSKGVISALERTIEVSPQMSMVDLIQTDASINQGNSGGPLVSVRGEVVGINTANLNQGYGIGFAINMDDVVEVVSQLVEFGFVRRGYLGVRVLGHVTQSLAEEFNLSVSSGVIIEPLSANTVAAIAGMRVGDIITEAGQQPILSITDLEDRITEAKDGGRKSLLLLVRRAGDPRFVALGLGD